MTPSNALTKLRGHMGKAASAWTDRGRKLIGDAGEFLTESYLDGAGISWIKTVQHEHVYSTMLRSAKVARPDYLIRVDGDNLFLDSKNLSRTTHTVGQLGFSIRTWELDRLRAAEVHFQLPVLLVIWDRSHTDFAYALAALSDFSHATTLNGEPAQQAFFTSGYFNIHPL